MRRRRARLDTKGGAFRGGVTASLARRESVSVDWTTSRQLNTAHSPEARLLLSMGLSRILGGRLYMVLMEGRWSSELGS